MPADHLHGELRQRNVAILRASTLVFGGLYVGWTALDILLLPSAWPTLLAIRLTVGAASLAVFLALRDPRAQARVWPLFWIWLYLCGAGIALMLPLAGPAIFAYLLGYGLVIQGAGLLPFWPPRLAISNVLATSLTGALVVGLDPGRPELSALLTGALYILTGGAAAVVMAVFKYDLARRDHESRTELARASERLKAALDRLSEADRLQRRFFANLTHELRTPLTLILAPVQDLLTDPRADPFRARLLAVEKNGERLLRLIDDLLDLARLEAGNLRIRVQPVELGELAALVVERAGPAAAREGIQLRLERGAAGPVVMGEAHRLDMVLTNLLGNALRYSPTGGRVDVRVGERDGRAWVEVEDEGPGIPPEEQRVIFERFARGQSAQGIGFGIGLSLARELVELHGGRLSLRSEPGRGACFRVEIPLGRDHLRPEAIERRSELLDRRTDPRSGGRRELDPVRSEVPLPALPAPSRPEERPVLLERGRRPLVLVAEDNPELRALLVELLGREFEVQAAADGEEALRLARELNPDLVLSDLAMPGRGGRSLCRSLRSEARFAATPIVVLTAWSGPELSVQLHADGADDFLAKPFHPRVLLARLRAHLRVRELGVQLAHRERLATVGALSAGLLHELRNPLHAALQAARLLRDPELEEGPRGEMIEVVVEALGRMRTLTEALDAHARPAERQGVGCLDLVAGLRGTARLVASRLEGRELRLDLPPCAMVEASSDIQQVFLNLIDNALRAGARLVVVRAAAEEDRWRVEVEDDGPGVPAALLPRIFEPFVSGRGEGEGSGLGLSICRRIVEQNQGRILLHSQEGHGCRVQVWLPAAEPA